MTNVQLRFLDTVHELSSVDVFKSDEQLCPLLEPVWIPEDHLDEGRATAWIIDDILRDALDVTVQFGEVQSVQTGGALAMLHEFMSHEAGTLPLSKDNLAHGSSLLPSAVEREVGAHKLVGISR